jgi:hypothetical protein
MSFLAVMQAKVKCPMPMSKKVGGRDVIYFPFFNSLQDLLRSTAFYDIDNLCTNKEEQDQFKHFQPTTVADSREIMSNEWASDIQNSIENDDDFDPDQDFFLPLMLYSDKTDMDINQWYPLEPWMFILVLLWLMAREDPKNWQHLGFIPSQDFAPPKKVILSPEEKLQQYHDYMLVLLNEVKEVSETKPMMWVNLRGIWKKKRMRIVLSGVSGDQKLQDYLCGRKASNNGSAGCIHHGCMALAVNSTAVGPDSALHGGCQKPPIEVLNRLNDLALMDVSDNANLGPMALIQQLLPAESSKEQREKHLVVQHLCCVQRLSKNILGRVFSMHAHQNAFDYIDFGANEHGILAAMAEDHLHSCESGIMLNLAEVAYSGLTDSDRSEFEDIVRKMVQGCTSSALAEYPHGTVKTDFGKLTLCSHKEKVGSVFYLLIALHNKCRCEIFDKAHEWQKEKYRTFPNKTTIASMNLAKQKKSNKAKAYCGKTNNDDETESNSDLSVEMDEDDSTDDDSDSDLGRTAIKLTLTELMVSTFPYWKDLLHSSDYQKKHPFDCSDESIDFVCEELCRHGFSFLMDGTKLDTFQLDLLMIVSWEILLPLKHKVKHPSSDTVQQLLTNDTLKDLILSQVESEEKSTDALINETSTKMLLWHTFPPQVVQINTTTEPNATPVIRYQHSLDLE